MQKPKQKPASYGYEIPDALGFLAQAARYKIAYGGRGSAKSWTVARVLLYRVARGEVLRILCCREFQRSIRDSVHRLLSDQIEIMGFSSRFQILDTEIRGNNGSLFTFAGLSTQSIESIKSFEGIDICWVEEGQVVSRRSWDILIPTIRKPNSEIWVTMNPQLETDETAQRFIINPPPDAIVRKINYTENPWFSDVLEKERLHCLRTNPRDYPNIWEGEFKPAVEGAIYYHEMAAAKEQLRIGKIPYDPTLLVHTVWDLGFNDATAVILCQVVGSEIRIIDYIEDSGRKISDYIVELKNKNYAWGNDWLPHDGFARLAQTGQSTADVFARLGRNVGRIPSVTVEAGIKCAREVFPRFYFNEDKAALLIERLKRYRRNIPASTDEPAKPLHDENSHGADALRGLALVANFLSNESFDYDNDWEMESGRSAIGGY